MKKILLFILVVTSLLIACFNAVSCIEISDNDCTIAYGCGCSCFTCFVDICEGKGCLQACEEFLIGSTETTHSVIESERDPSDEPGVSRALRDSDIVIDVLPMEVYESGSNAVDKVVFTVDVTGKSAYVYMDCEIVIIYEYKLMDSYGEYSNYTQTISVSLDRTGCGKASESVSVNAYSAKAVNYTIEEMSGKVSAK